MNNLLERLHASFFFFILTGPERFIKIGGYLPSAILISVAMMFQGLGTWVDAAWVLDDSEESSQTREKASNTPLKWRKRRRPVIPALLIMTATHIFGGLLFFILTRSWFMENCQVNLLVIIPLFGSHHLRLDSFTNNIHILCNHTPVDPHYIQTNI